MIRRGLICERCGAEQYAVGRVIEEAEREVSYRWCRRCLDQFGPCGTDPEVVVVVPPVVPPVVAKTPKVKATKVKKVKAPKTPEVKAPALPDLAIGDSGTWHGAWHEDCVVVETYSPWVIAVRFASGRRLVCRRDEVSHREMKEAG